MQTIIDFESLKEVQQNEIEALKAIFMEDFHEVVNKTAWKVKCQMQEEGWWKTHTHIIDMHGIGIAF